MPFGTSMDAWASYYDYPTDEIEVEDAVGSARPSSELDQSELHQRDDRLSHIRLESLPPSSVPNAALQPIDALYEQLFPTNQNNATRQSTPSPALPQHNGGNFDLTTDNPQPHQPPTSHLDSGSNVHVALHQDLSTDRRREEETFSYNTTQPLALVERKMARTWIGLTSGEIKLLALAGAGFLMDAYDLFIINSCVPILSLAYGPRSLEWGLHGGVLKASASMGNVVGQLLFGFLGDFWGRSVLYGKELMLAMIAIIIMISAPDSIHGKGVTIWIAVLRFIMGVGIGADYPMLATVVADRSSLKTRGLLLSLIFSNQGWGALAASLAALSVVGGYRSSIESDKVAKLSGAWRILLGLPLAPAFIVLYFRLTLVESARFVQARYLQDHNNLATHASAAGMVLNSDGKAMPISPSSVYTSTEIVKRANKERKISETPSSLSSPLSSSNESRYKNSIDARPRHRPSLTRHQLPSPKDLREAMRKAAAQNVGFSFRSIGVAQNDFFDYFREWQHLRILIGTSLSWFLVDITYGINLNQSAILSLIGFTQGDQWERVFKQALGNLIVILAGFLPGYYLTVALVEIVGRKKI
ncbi:hypothetical protein NDA16_000842 [Ustilago loliicola]|nr:hypothetical protein NDA16_000842 [Ustilago loliicola]